MNYSKPWIAALAVVGLAGCTATPPTVLPVAEAPMIAIYRHALTDGAGSGDSDGVLDADAVCGELANDDDDEAECLKVLSQYTRDALQAIDAHKPPESVDYRDYTRSATAEIDSLFPRLPNPDLVIYVYPHLATRTRAPIPGYATAIPLYNQVEYRLPGEALLATPPAASAPSEAETR